LFRKPRGFGFVTFSEKQSALNSLVLNGSTFEGRTLTVRAAAARGTGSLKEHDDDDDDDDENLIVNKPKQSLTPTLRICKYEMMPGGCKFGNRCKFSHDMNNWSGAGVEEVKKNTKPLKTKKQPTKQVSKPLAPRCALIVTEERLAFLRNKIASCGEPSPIQLGVFLKSLGDLLRKALQDDRCKFNMESIYWSYDTNSCLDVGGPPSVKQVEKWLKDPCYIPPPEVSLKEFEFRAQSSQIATLLSEYGSYDSSWRDTENK